MTPVYHLGSLVRRVASRHANKFKGHRVVADEFTAKCETCEKFLDTTTDGHHPEFVTFWSPDMKITHEQGWDVTSPILAGSSEDLQLAVQCAHPEYREVLRATQDGMSLIQEKCTSCVAVRMKTRPVEADGLDRAR